MLHQKIKRLHPDWKVILWNDDEKIDLIDQYFPNLMIIYNSLQYNIMRADIIRYVYINVYGGYYLDLDYELFKAFDNTFSTANLFLPISGKQKKDKVLGNSIFGSTQGHIFWKDVLEKFENNPPLKKFYNKMEVLKLTGPFFISGVYYSDPSRYNATLVEQYPFHPYNSLVNKKNYESELAENGNLGIHHCEGSWLRENNSILNYLSRGAGSIKRRISS